MVQVRAHGGWRGGSRGEEGAAVDLHSRPHAVGNRAAVQLDVGRGAHPHARLRVLHALLEGQTALQIARQKRLLSATCLPQRATTGAREPSSEAEESEARAFELLEDLIGNGGDVSRTSLRRGS